MIHEVLPSDVEFVRGLLNGSHSDAEILAALASRGLEPAKAAQLLDDLRHGRRPDTHVPSALASPAPRATHGPRKTRTHAPPLVDSRPPESRHRKHKSDGVSWWAIIVGAICLWALWFIFFRAGADASQDVINLDKHHIPDAPTKEAPR